MPFNLTNHRDDSKISENRATCPPPQILPCDTEGRPHSTQKGLFSQFLTFFSHNFTVNAPLWHADFEKKCQHLKKWRDWRAPVP